MNLFPRRRQAVLAELKLPQDVFTPLDTEAGEATPPEPDEQTPVSPINELATALVELDIAQALRADYPPPAEPADFPAPLSQRHLDTIDRMVAHLKADEKRLQQQIRDARRQLADTRLTRHGYERNVVELRRGIGALIERASPKRRLARRRAGSPQDARQPVAANDIGEVHVITVLKAHVPAALPQHVLPAPTTGSDGLRAGF